MLVRRSKDYFVNTTDQDNMHDLLRALPNYIYYIGDNNISDQRAKARMHGVSKEEINSNEIYRYLSRKHHRQTFQLNALAQYKTQKHHSLSLPYVEEISKEQIIENTIQRYSLMGLIIPILSIQLILVVQAGGSLIINLKRTSIGSPTSPQNLASRDPTVDSSSQVTQQQKSILRQEAQKYIFQ